MELVAIGDIHGFDTWKQFTEKKFDKYVFIGDYFDNYEKTSAAEQIHNFKEICDFKRSNPDGVDLLIGNHDFHYLRGNRFQYAGFQYSHKIDIQETLHIALDEGVLKMCAVYDKYLFTHAGVTKTWCDNNNIDLSNIEESINDLFKYKPNAFEFNVGENYDEYGDDICQTPIWIRPKSLMQDKIDGFVQVVGHTRQNTIVDYGSVILIGEEVESNYYQRIFSPPHKPLMLSPLMSEWQDSNLRPPAPKAGAIPTTLHSEIKKRLTIYCESFLMLLLLTFSFSLH